MVQMGHAYLAATLEAIKAQEDETDLRAAPLERVHAGLVLGQAIGDGG